MAELDPAEGLDNPEANERPEWLPENFNSPEDLARSYRELQGAFTRETQARSALEENYASLSSRFDEYEASLQAQVQPTSDPYSQARYLADQFGVEPEQVNAMAYIAQQVAQSTAQSMLTQQQDQANPQVEALKDLAITQAADSLRAKYDDWDEVVDQVRETLEAKPYLVSDQDLLSSRVLAERFDDIYKTVKFDKAQQGGTTASGQQGMDDLSLRMKINAQTATGASGRPDPIADEKARWEAIKNAKGNTYG